MQRSVVPLICAPALWLVTVAAVPVECLECSHALLSAHDPEFAYAHALLPFCDQRTTLGSAAVLKPCLEAMALKLRVGDSMFLMNSASGVEYDSARMTGTKSSGRSHWLTPVDVFLHASHSRQQSRQHDLDLEELSGFYPSYTDL